MLESSSNGSILFLIDKLKYQYYFTLEIYHLTPISETEGTFTFEYLFYGPGTTPDRGTGTYRWIMQPDEASNLGEIIFDKEYIRTDPEGGTFEGESIITLKMIFSSEGSASGSSTITAAGGESYTDEGYTFTITPTSD